MKKIRIKNKVQTYSDNKWLEATMNLKGYVSNGLAGWKYTGLPDPKPLASLLYTADTHPHYIAELLAHLLAGGGGGGLPRVKFIPSKHPKHFEKLIRNLSEMRETREKFYELISKGSKRKNAVKDLAVSENRKLTWIEDSIALTDDDFLMVIKDGALPKSKLKRVINKTTRKVL